MKVGRPTDYKPEYDEIAEKLCKLGMTDKDLAEFFEVCESTINNWKNNFPSFLESLKNGKLVADANVAEKLYRRATGYEHDDVHIAVTKDGLPVEVPFVKKYAPDVTAIIYWLNNRQPEKWKTRQMQKVEVSELPPIIIPDGNETEQSISEDKQSL